MWECREFKSFYYESKVYGMFLRKVVKVNFEIYEICFEKQNFFHSQDFIIVFCYYL